MYFSPIIPDMALWLLCATFACIIILSAIYILRVRSVINYRRRADRERPRQTRCRLSAGIGSYLFTGARPTASKK